MIKYIQSFFAAAGKNACYAFCLYDVAKEYLEKHGLPILVNELEALEMGVSRGYINFNFSDYDDPDAFYVTKPHLFLRGLTGIDWTARKEGRDYIALPGEYVIEFSALSEKNGGLGIGHFWRTRNNPLQRSNSSEKGFIYSKRVFQPIAGGKK